MVQRTLLKPKLLKAAKAKDEQLVLELIDQLKEWNPTEAPASGLGSTSKAPLAGAWKLAFTNARDAEAPARSEGRAESFSGGDSVPSGVRVTTGQRIRGETGLCTNFISLEGEKRPFDQLEIEIQMTPLTESRVRLDFLRGRAKNANAPLPFLRDFSFNFLPLWVGDFLCFLRGRNPQTDPPAYFDVLYLDNELRVHQTGEGKVFVQTRG